MSDLVMHSAWATMKSSSTACSCLYQSTWKSVNARQYLAHSESDKISHLSLEDILCCILVLKEE
jgi:hypothetical protein